jgi:hypothetical protein
MATLQESNMTIKSPPFIQMSFPKKNVYVFYKYIYVFIYIYIFIAMFYVEGYITSTIAFYIAMLIGDVYNIHPHL